MITIKVNGNTETVPSGSTLSDLLDSIGSEGKTVATVVNEQVVRPENRAAAVLHEDDRIELLVFAGGG